MTREMELYQAKLKAALSNSPTPAQREKLYRLHTQKISDLLSQSQNFDELYQKMRIDIVDFLMSTGYMNFNVQPYQDGNYAIVVQS